MQPPGPPLSNAERQRLFRERRGDAGKKKDAERKAAERAAKKEAAENDLPAQAEKFNKILAKEGLPVNQEIYVEGAPHGKGLPLQLSRGYRAGKEAVRKAAFESGARAGLTPEILELYVSDVARGANDDGRRVEPHGAGEATILVKVEVVRGGAAYIRVEPPIFRVWLNDEPEDSPLTTLINDLVAHHFETVAAIGTITDANGDLISEGHPELYRCLLCGTEILWPRDCYRHVETEHAKLVRQVRYGQKTKGGK